MISNFPFNFIIIPVIVIATAIIGSRYVKRGRVNSSWYENLHKPKWTPDAKLIGEIWTFLYVITGLGILWYWNVPVFSWFHYVVAAVLLVNAYLNATWNKIFFIEHNFAKALKTMKIMIGTALLAAVLMYFATPIASFLLLPYIVWVGITMKLTREIKDMNVSNTK